MYEMIKEKKARLDACGPLSPDLRAWVEQSDIWCWLYSMFRISGRKMQKNNVVAMVAGELRDDIPLSAYAVAKGFKDVYSDMKACLQMKADLDLKMLDRWAGMLLGKPSDDPQNGLYRQNNPIIYEWELIPVHFRQIKEELTALLRRAAQIKDPKDPMDKASFVHLEIDRIYPYGEDTAMVSGAALMYLIMQQGLPLPELSVGDIEYNKMIAKYAEDLDRGDFCGMLSRSVYNRLDAVCSLALCSMKSLKV